MIRFQPYYRHDCYTADQIAEEEDKMTNVFTNLSFKKAEIILEDSPPNYLLSIKGETLHQFIMIEEQLQDLRRVIYITNKEAEEMYQDHLRSEK